MTTREPHGKRSVVCGTLNFDLCEAGIMFRLLTVLSAAAIVAAMSASPCRAQEGFDSLYSDGPYVTSFRLTDQQGQPVHFEDLRGKVWVATFFYSTCIQCSRLTLDNVARLQKDLAGYPDVMLVSFSVYPDQDTPPQLQQFAGHYQVNPNRWLLLTGPKDDIYDLIRTSFQRGVMADPGPFFFAGSAVGLHADPIGTGPLLTATTLFPDRPENPAPKHGAEIIHSFHFVVVDHNGKIRGYVDGTNPDEVARLEQRVKELVQIKYFPKVNASLNGLSAVLILTGYLFIRRRWIALHKACMLAALAVSTLFLCSYLYYHFVLLHGQRTEFPGEGLPKTVYLAVLVSHSFLAVIVAPLALVTTYLGLRNRLSRHVSLARWTLPLWLYVSVTGVVVYWMLYHWYAPGS
jgi:protein SCO1/2/putative membrane protein